MLCACAVELAHARLPGSSSQALGSNLFVLRQSGRVKRSSLLVSLPLYRLFTILTLTNTCSKAVVCLLWTNLHLLPQVSVVRHSGRVKRSSLLVSLPLYRMFTILTLTNTCSKAVVCLLWTNLHLLPQVSVVRHSGRVKRSSLLVSLPLYRLFTILTLTNTCSKAVVCLLWTNLHLLPQVSVVRHSGRVKRSSLLVSLPLYRLFLL